MGLRSLAPNHEDSDQNLKNGLLSAKSLEGSLMVEEEAIAGGEVKQAEWRGGGLRR
ncbi:hypothetical protein CCACVL1_08068 [Corchorus capsularis]|uniref:Uncharacterized protein n=1 Tax=Corchorus capsularis TaxID=210143 RepID=A0A1R3J2D4_COCAP|nr:hypothetical protein CCACVL1_08068 [Corchorus capsularis]